MEKMQPEASVTFEHLILQYLEAKRAYRGMSMFEWGRRSFFTQSKSVSVRMNNFFHTRVGYEKIKRLTVGDFVLLCQGMDLNPAEVFSLVFLDANKKLQSGGE